MTTEVRMPDSPKGKSCRTCRKWDGESCTDRRHANADPDRPCLLYRYRQQAAAEPRQESAFCASCRRKKPIEEFIGGRDYTYKTCIECRMKHRAYKKARKKR